MMTLTLAVSYESSPLWFPRHPAWSDWTLTVASVYLLSSMSTIVCIVHPIILFRFHCNGSGHVVTLVVLALDLLALILLALVLLRPTHCQDLLCMLAAQTLTLIYWRED